MNPRRANQLLWMAAAGMALAAVGVIAAAVWVPLASETVEAAGTRQLSRGSRDHSLPPLASFEPIWQLRLRHDMGATAGAQPVVAADVAADSAPVTLVGTVGTSLALIRTADGQVKVTAPGERAGDVELIEVRAGEVIVRTGGQMTRLRKPQAANEP